MFTDSKYPSPDGSPNGSYDVEHFTVLDVPGAPPTTLCGLGLEHTRNFQKAVRSSPCVECATARQRLRYLLDPAGRRRVS